MRLARQLVVERAEEFVDGKPVPARLGRERIADHTLVVRVGLDPLGRLLVEGIDLGIDPGAGLGRERRHGREPVIEPSPGCLGVAFGLGQQADGEVGHPVTQVGEGAARVVGHLDARDDPVGGDRGLGRLVECADQVEVRSDEAGDQQDREQDQAGPDRETVEEAHQKGGPASRRAESAGTAPSPCGVTGERA